MYFVSTRDQNPQSYRCYDPTSSWWSFVPTLEEAKRVGKNLLLDCNCDCDTAYIFEVTEDSFELIYEGFFPEPTVSWTTVN